MRTRLLAVILLSPLLLTGCKSLADGMITGSLGTSQPPSQIATSEAGWRAVAARWAPVYQQNPGNAVAALNYGRALRAIGQRSQSLAVLQTGVIKNTNDMPLLGEYGRALADNGRFTEALEVLGRAHTPDRPDWRVLTAQGAVLDQMDRGAEALNYYQTALKIVPGEPSVLSNMGLSYALQNDLTTAEKVMRQAYANPRADSRVRLNLALVLALQGRFQDAEAVARQDLGPEQAAQNTQALRAMVAETNNWQKLRQIDKKPAPKG